MTTATRFRTLKDMPAQDYLTPGNTMCAGCGGILAVRVFHKVLGPNVAWVNAAGCMTITMSYPLSPLKSNWLYTAFASAPAGAGCSTLRPSRMRTSGRRTDCRRLGRMS